MPSGKVVFNLKRYHTRREEEGDKNRMYNCNVTTCFTGEKHSNHNFYMSVS